MLDFCLATDVAAAMSSSAAGGVRWMWHYPMALQKAGHVIQTHGQNMPVRIL